MTDLQNFIRQMPKVELHVHLEGATQPATLIKLAKKHNVALPADTVEGIQEWYTFTDFNHFLEIYRVICACISSPEDIELLAREFLVGQAAQNIVYSEVTYTNFAHSSPDGERIPFDDQLAALNRARAWAEAELGVTMRYIIDIPRMVAAEDGLEVAQWVATAMDRGVIALGLGGPEIDHPPSDYAEAFAYAHEHNVPCILHAGETVGPESIREALDVGHSLRLGHGVRCVEDADLVAELREKQIPLEVCPTSNVCLGVVPDFESHMLPQLMDEGLYVTLNSDDPPMFNTTLTDEYLKASAVFGWDKSIIENMVLNGVRASLLPDAEKQQMEADFKAQFEGN